MVAVAPKKQGEWGWSSSTRLRSPSPSSSSSATLNTADHKTCANIFLNIYITTKSEDKVDSSACSRQRCGVQAIVVNIFRWVCGDHLYSVPAGSISWLSDNYSWSIWSYSCRLSLSIHLTTRLERCHWITGRCRSRPQSLINGADDRGRQCTASCSCSQAMISGSISCSAGCEATLCSAAASITRMQPALITGHCSDISYGGGIVLVSGVTLQHVSCMQQWWHARARNGPILQISWQQKPGIMVCSADNRGLCAKPCQCCVQCMQVVTCDTHCTLPAGGQGDRWSQGRGLAGPRAPHPGCSSHSIFISSQQTAALTSTSPAWHLQHAGNQCAPPRGLHTVSPILCSVCGKYKSLPSASLSLSPVTVWPVDTKHGDWRDNFHDV